MNKKLEKCPGCGKMKELLALSRKDNETMICNSCGTTEALLDFLGSDEDE